MKVPIAFGHRHNHRCHIEILLTGTLSPFRFRLLLRSFRRQSSFLNIIEFIIIISFNSVVTEDHNHKYYLSVLSRSH